MTHIWRQFKMSWSFKRLLKYYMQTLCLIPHTKYLLFPSLWTMFFLLSGRSRFWTEASLKCHRRARLPLLLHQANIGHKILGIKLADLGRINKLNITWKLMGFHHFKHPIAMATHLVNMCHIAFSPPQIFSPNCLGMSILRLLPLCQGLF